MGKGKQLSADMRHRLHELAIDRLIEAHKSSEISTAEFCVRMLKLEVQIQKSLVVN